MTEQNETRECIYCKNEGDKGTLTLHRNCVLPGEHLGLGDRPQKRGNVWRCDRNPMDHYDMEEVLPR